MSSDNTLTEKSTADAWKQELEYCLLNYKNDRNCFNTDCLKNAICKLKAATAGSSNDDLLTKAANELSKIGTGESLDDYKPHSVISLFDGGVLNVYADAIVNAANSALRGGGGVDGAIHMAAGSGLHEACLKLHCCATGDAKVTPSFNLKSANYIIHTVGPVYQHCADDPVLLSSSYRRSLDEAYKLKCTSIGFCCISTGVYGYPLTEACTVARDSIRAWIKEHDNTVMNIYLCCFSKAELDAYRQALG